MGKLALLSLAENLAGLNPVYEPGVGKPRKENGKINPPVLIPFMNRAWGNLADDMLDELAES